MCDLKKTPAAPKFVMYVTENGRHATIYYDTPESSQRRGLTGRQARVIVALQRKFEQGKGMHEGMGRFLSAKALAQAYEETPGVNPPKETTMTTYLSELWKVLTGPGPEGDVLPQLIERVPNWGARLLHPVEIHFLGRPNECELRSDRRPGPDEA